MNKIRFLKSFSPILMDEWNYDQWDLPFENNELDLYETNNSIVVEVKCPGFNPEDLEITLEGKVLSITGEVSEEKEKEEKKYYRKEISNKSFTRSITLPGDVKIESIESIYSNGILKLTLPRIEEEKKQSIKIKVNN